MHTPAHVRSTLAWTATALLICGACKQDAPAPPAAPDPAPTATTPPEAKKPATRDPHAQPSPTPEAPTSATQYAWTPTSLKAIRAWLDGTCAPEALKRKGKDTSCEAPGGYTLRMRSRTGHFLEPDAQEVALMVWDSRIPAKLGGGYLIVLREGRDGWRVAAQLSDSGPGGEDARWIGAVPRADGREGIVACRESCAGGCCEDRCALLYLDAPKGGARATWHPLYTTTRRADDARAERVQRARVEAPASDDAGPLLALTLAPPKRAKAAPAASKTPPLRWTLDWSGGAPTPAKDNPKPPAPACRVSK